MEKIKYLTEQSLKEIEDWVKDNPDDSYDFASLRRKLQSLLTMSTIEQATRQVHIIMHEIADQGPYSDAFLPSFQQLASYLYAWERKQKGKLDWPNKL
jgi:hypothetical protein